MLAEINGVQRKVACGPCIRGHRSSKCDHRDRVLLEVRKPGRPLSSCPHPSGSCGCERTVINYTIPKTASECACPSEQAASAATPSSTSNRVHKTRRRKSTSTFSPAALEKLEEAVKASHVHDGRTDSVSEATRTPTNTSFIPSEKSSSTEASPPSSASSTPRMAPVPSRSSSYSANGPIVNASAVPSQTSEPRRVSSCCASKAPPPLVEHVPQPQRASCCSNNGQDQPQPFPVKKSCCSGSGISHQPQFAPFGQANGFHGSNQSHFQFPQQQSNGHVQHQHFGNTNSDISFPTPGHLGMGMTLPFNTPIYNHVSGYQQQAPLPINTPHPIHHAGTHATKHNCHCGENCSCFGCAAHPNNATMTEYVRLMHQFMLSGGFGPNPAPTYDVPSFANQHALDAGPNQSMSFSHTPQPAGFMQYGGGQMPHQGSMNTGLGMPHTPAPAAMNWQQASVPTPMPAPTAPQYFSANTPAQDASQPMKMEESETPAVVADSPQENREEDAQLSPSSYFWQEMVLPGCDDATGTCQCGEGCECVGCLTHGGHNGIPLEVPATDQQFADFGANNNFSGINPSLMPGM